MVKSTLTSKGQTTVPKEIRLILGLEPHSPLIWEVQDGVIIVTPGSRRFLYLRGSIKVGRGSAVEDVRKARKIRGRERW